MQLHSKDIRQFSVQMALSTQEKVLLRIPLQQPPLEALLTRQQLDSLAVPLFKRALVPLEDACQQVCRTDN